MYRSIVFAVTTMVAFGQLGLHDSSADALAKKTQSAFEAISNSDSHTPENIVANTLAMKEATLAQLYDLNRQRNHAEVERIPEWTWATLRGKVKASQDELLDVYRTSYLTLTGSSSAATNAAAAMRQARKHFEELARVKKEKEQTLGDVAKGGEACNLKNMRDALESVRVGMTAAGKRIQSLSDLAEFEKLQLTWSGIKDAKEWLDAAEQPTKTPGLALTILDVGIQRQQFKADRLQIEMDHLSVQQSIALKIVRRLDQIWKDGRLDYHGELRQGDFGKIYSYLEICAPSEDCQHPFLASDAEFKEQVGQTVERWSTLAKEETNPRDARLTLRNVLDAVSRYVSLIGYQRYLFAIDMIESVTENQIFAVRESDLAAKERSMLISHGFEGLADPYAGAINPESIAEAMRTTQVVASTVILGRMN